MHNITLKCLTMKYIHDSAHAMYRSESLTLVTIFHASLRTFRAFGTICPLKLVPRF